MGDEKISLLSERERACLRLVARGYSSKEIAAELRLSHHTVDLYVKRAMKTLSANSRRDAARQLELAEVAGNQELATHSPELAESLAMPAMSSPARMGRFPEIRMPFLRNGRQTNDLTSVERLAWIMALSVIILFVVATFLNGLIAFVTIAK